MRRTGHWARASLGRLGWLVIRAFHASLLIGADLYLAGPSVESMRHGGADGRHLIPENNRHSRCDDDSSCNHGDGYRILHPANMRMRGTQASRIPCHNQTDPTTGGPRCGALAGPLSRRASHRPEDCSAQAGNPLATWRTIAIISCTISPRAPPVAPLSRYSTRRGSLLWRHLGPQTPNRPDLTLTLPRVFCAIAD